MSNNQPITDKADEFVFNLFKEKQQNWLVYHNYNHTVQVVEASIEIGKGSKLNDSELEIVTLAAWFHDTGYIEKFKEHEKISVQIATKYLNAQEYPKDKTKRVLSCIEATSLSQKPNNLLEEVISDADLINLGKTNYDEKSKLLKTETELATDKAYSEIDWLNVEIDFLTSHKFHTKFAQVHFNEEKFKNLTIRQNELHMAILKKEETDKKLELKELDIQRKLEKSLAPERGVETMFRTSLRNHMDLSAIADNKANIMLSINAIIISITVTGLLPSFKENPYLILPTSFLLLVCLITIVFATLATKPKVTSGTFTKRDIKNKTSNLLFFGNFHNMELEEFEWGIKEMMKDKDFLYGSMIKDFYSLGKVLSKKYKFLRMCYLVFMYGMILAVAFFGIMLTLHY